MTTPTPAGGTAAIALPAAVLARAAEARDTRTLQQRMQLVLELADINQGLQGGPFAAAVFDLASGRLISVGVNRVVAAHTSLAHAEVLALMAAQQHLGTWDLAGVGDQGCQLVTSAQPCIQCFGAVWWSGVRGLAVSARAADVEGIIGFREGPVPTEWRETLSRRAPLPAVEVVTDVLREDGRRVLRRYVENGGAVYNPGGAISGGSPGGDRSDQDGGGGG